MELKVDQEACSSCDLCPMIAPEFFQMNDDYVAEVIKQPEELTDEIQEAIDSCASGAISYE